MLLRLLRLLRLVLRVLRLLRLRVLHHSLSPHQAQTAAGLAQAKAYKAVATAQAGRAAVVWLAQAALVAAQGVASRGRVRISSGRKQIGRLLSVPYALTFYCACTQPSFLSNL